MWLKTLPRRDRCAASCMRISSTRLTRPQRTPFTHMTVPLHRTPVLPQEERRKSSRKKRQESPVRGEKKVPQRQRWQSLKRGDESHPIKREKKVPSEERRKNPLKEEMTVPSRGRRKSSQCSLKRREESQQEHVRLDCQPQAHRAKRRAAAIQTRQLPNPGAHRQEPTPAQTTWRYKTRPDLLAQRLCPLRMTRAHAHLVHNTRTLRRVRCPRTG